MKNTLEKLHEITAAVEASAYRLKCLSDAFYATGNEMVASKLSMEANDLMAAVDGADKAWDADMDEQMSHASAMMGGILNLALNSEIKLKPRKVDPA